MISIFSKKSKYDNADTKSRIEADNISYQRQINKVDIPQEGNIPQGRNSIFSIKSKYDKNDMNYRIKNDELAYKIRTQQPFLVDQSQLEPQDEATLDTILNGFQIPVSEPDYDIPTLEKELGIEDDPSILNRIEQTKRRIDYLAEQIRERKILIDRYDGQKHLNKSKENIDAFNKIIEQNDELIRQLETERRSAENELRNLQANYYDINNQKKTNERIRRSNEQIIRATEDGNIKKLEDYENTIRQLNKGKYNLKPAPDETPEQYKERTRIDVAENQKASYDRYKLQIDEKFRKELNKLVKNLTIVNDISQTSDTDQTFIILEQIAHFTTEFDKELGKDAKLYTSVSISHFITKF